MTSHSLAHCSRVRISLTSLLLCRAVAEGGLPAIAVRLCASRWRAIGSFVTVDSMWRLLDDLLQRRDASLDFPCAAFAGEFPPSMLRADDDTGVGRQSFDFLLALVEQGDRGVESVRSRADRRITEVQQRICRRGT